jgi:hypothetical protein
LLSRRHTLLLLLLCLSCDGDGSRTAAQLVLTPDPTIAPASALVREIRRIDVIVGSREGLRGAEQPGPLPGGGTALDWDGDGKLDVRFSAVAPGPELPVLEVGVGDNAGRDLVFRIFGFSSTEETDTDLAAGQGGASVAVPAGEVRRVGAPFNLTPRARPPQVLLVLPADGVKVPANLGSITAVLSTAVKPESLAGNVRLISPKGVVVAVEVKSELATVASTTFSKEQRSVLSITFPPFAEWQGSYELQIGPGISSLAGKRFDQDPQTPTEEPFVSHFTVEGETGGGSPCDACPAAYLCDEAKRCLPVLGCAAGCNKGLVCDSAQGQCVQDCRGYGLCFDPAALCDAKTGLCHR